MDTPRPRKIEERIAVGAMALLVAITLLNVVSRYLTDESFAWTEEISVFLMIVLTLAGAASAAAGDSQIRIEYFYDAGSAPRRRRFALFAAVVSAVFLAFFALLFGGMVWDEIRWAETSMGLGVPRWWYSAWIPPLCLFIAWRFAQWARRVARDGAPEPSSSKTPGD